MCCYKYFLYFADADSHNLAAVWDMMFEPLLMENQLYKWYIKESKKVFNWLYLFYNCNKKLMSGILGHDKPLLVRRFDVSQGKQKSITTKLCQL